MRRLTIASLQEQIETLSPYQEFFFVRDEEPIVIRSGEFEFRLYGVHRASGGVVTYGRTGVYFAEYSCQQWEKSRDPHLKECASQVRIQQAAQEHRVTQGRWKGNSR